MNTYLIKIKQTNKTKMKKQFFDLISEIINKKDSEEIESYKNDLIFWNLGLNDCMYTNDNIVYISFTTLPVLDKNDNPIKLDEELQLYIILKECGFDDSNSYARPISNESFSFSGLVKMNDNFKKHLKELLKIHTLTITIFSSPKIEKNKPKISRLDIKCGICFYDNQTTFKHVVSVEGDDDMINKYNKGEFFS